MNLPAHPDVPVAATLLAADDIRPLLRAWAQRTALTQAQVPVVGGVRGHPVLLSWQAVQLIAEQPGTRGSAGVDARFDQCDADADDRAGRLRQR